MLRAELQLELESSTFWIDSIMVLKYIKNKTKCFYVFVVNRISAIRELIAVSQWRYINTKHEASHRVKVE